jgi:prophage regulatory protein
LFPKPIKLSARAAGWPLHEIDALVAARVAGRSDNEIRALVTRLEASRTAADRGH